MILSVNKEVAKLLMSKCKNTYPLIAPENTNFPFVIYGRSAATPTYTKFGLVSATLSFDISVYGNSYEQSFKLANDIIDELNKNQDIRIENANEMYSEGTFVQSITLTILKNI